MPGAINKEKRRERSAEKATSKARRQEGETLGERRRTSVLPRVRKDGREEF